MKNLLNRKIPTILGIALIAMGIPLTTFFLKNQTFVRSQASGSQDPQNVEITNISDQTFTVTYQTDVMATGSINYGPSKQLGKSALEDIDEEKGSFSPKIIHSMSVNQLTPSTKYYLAIISGYATFLDDGNPYTATTAPNISSSSAQENIIKGKIILPNGSMPPEAIVYLNTDNSQTLSSTTDSDGEFSFSLKNLRTSNLSSYFNVNDDTVFEISATDGSLKSNASFSLNQTGSIPTMTLSNDYNFTQDTSPAASKSAQALGFPLTSPGDQNLTPKILSPKDKQSFSSQKPQFSGIGIPNEKIDITINSADEITAQVTADSNGNWIYQPTTNLAPGDHTITIKARDSQGILTTITQSFTVYAAELPTPASTASSVVTAPTILPTQIPIMTQVPTPAPSPIALPIRTKSGLPPTGNSPTLLFTGGIIMTISGIILLLLTHSVL